MNCRYIFTTWMQMYFDIKASTIKKYTSAIATISRDLSEHTGKNIDIYELGDFSSVYDLEKQYFGEEGLRKKNEKAGGIYMTAFQRYEVFLESIDFRERLEREADSQLIERLVAESLEDADEDFQFNGKPKEKETVMRDFAMKPYPRDIAVSINALAHAHYCCEVDKSHLVFLRKGSERNYTEPHHLVPMKYLDLYKYSLDVEENIVSLCSNCHRQLHSGRDVEAILKKLYGARQNDLNKAGIEISFEDLLEMYK